MTVDSPSRRIALRTDASLQIGTGHVMRCLTLADALRGHGAECTFICRPHSGHLLELIAQRGHQAVALPAPTAVRPLAAAAPAHAAWLGTDWESDAQQTRQALSDKIWDWLVVDHYALDRRWEQALRPACQRLMVIDDLADRPHDSDLLLDQNLGRCAKDYFGLLNRDTTTLIGPQYALLRPEFAQLRAQSLARRAEPELKHLLITMGGVDKDNATGNVLDALKDCPLPPELRVTVVMGPHAPWLAQVAAQAAAMPCPTQVRVGVNNMAQLMADSDLAIGAAGSTAWERCCLGLPTAMVVLANNQEQAAQRLLQWQAVSMLRLGKNLKADLVLLFSTVISNNRLLKSIGDHARTVTDGTGSQSVAGILLKRSI